MVFTVITEFWVFTVVTEILVFKVVIIKFSVCTINIVHLFGNYLNPDSYRPNGNHRKTDSYRYNE